MRQYKYKCIDENCIYPCNSCQMNAPVDLFKSNKYPNGRELCEICASSFIANATEYPEIHDNVELFQSIAMVANILLDKLTDRRKEINESSIKK